jgi:hypothetical protein
MFPISVLHRFASPKNQWCGKSGGLLPSKRCAVNSFVFDMIFSLELRWMRKICVSRALQIDLAPAATVGALIKVSSNHRSGRFLTEEKGA